MLSFFYFNKFIVVKLFLRLSRGGRMNSTKKASPLIIGMALFAMFFGSGNLIYPLYIGSIAKGSWVAGSMGFLIGAALLPFLGVVAMVLYEGCYRTFFSTLGRKGGLLLSALLLTVWIPLGSAPRCITVAHASLSSYTGYTPSLWIFSLLYSGLVYAVITRKIGVLEILGRYITPVLLGCIAVICLRGIFFTDHMTPLPASEHSMFLTGAVEGVNTMDLIASFFFSASVIHLLNRSSGNLKESVSMVFRSGMVGVSLLAIVYVGLIALSAYHSELLVNVPKDQALAFVAQQLLGPTWSILAIVAISFACFSTSIALIIAYADFLSDEVFKNADSTVLPTALAIAVSFVMSLFGLSGITMVTAPILQVCYPILFVLIVLNILRKTLRSKQSYKSALEKTT